MNLAYDVYVDIIAEAVKEPYTKEYFFFPKRKRKWRFDYAFLDIKLAIEFDGGNWIQGRHNTATGRRNDIEKINAAQDLGWKVYNVLPNEVDIDALVRSIKIRQEEMKNGTVT